LDANLAQPPESAPNITGFTQFFGLTLAQILLVRQQALFWYRDRFGLDISNPISQPGYIIVLPVPDAIVVPVRFDSPWNLVSSTPVLPSAVLKLAEFPLQFEGEAPIYGGTYGAWLQSIGKSTQGNNTDALSYGLYGANFAKCPLQFLGNCIQQADGSVIVPFLVKSAYPIQVFQEIFSSERTCIFNQVYGQGFANTDLTIPFVTEENIKASSAWRFPYGVDLGDPLVCGPANTNELAFLFA